MRPFRKCGKAGNVQRHIYWGSSENKIFFVKARPLLDVHVFAAFAHPCASEHRAHDCMDAGGTTPRMGEVEPRLEQRSRATPGRSHGCER